MKKIILCILMMAKRTEILSSIKSFDYLSKNPCEQYFNISSDFYYPSVLFFPEYHDNQQDDEKISDCIDILARPGDRLLIEILDTGNQVDCASVNPVYKKLNKKLACYGFDVGLDSKRESYNTYAYRANLLFKMDKLLEGETSAKIIRQDILEFAVKLEETKAPSDFPIKDFYQKNGKYLKKLCRKISGLNVKEIEEFLTQENIRLAKKADEFEELSRMGPTNQGLVNSINSHHSQLSTYANSQRLFVIAGARHFDRSLNTFLTDLNPDDTQTLTYTP